MSLAEPAENTYKLSRVLGRPLFWAAIFVRFGAVELYLIQIQAGCNMAKALYYVSNRSC
jgi:hypothetical protein